MVGKVFGGGGAACGLLGSADVDILGQVEQAKSIWQRTKDLVGDHGVLLWIAAALAIWLIFEQLKKLMREDVESGRYQPSGG